MAEDRFRDRAGLSPHSHENFFWLSHSVRDHLVNRCKTRSYYGGLLLFHHALQGMLVLAREIITWVTLVSAIS